MSRLIIHRNHLPYVPALAIRRRDRVDLAVIHCTELPDLAMAREFGERIIYPDSQTGNSGHYYIDRSGHVEEWVSIDRVAHHVRGFNKCSVGVELINNGRFPDWHHSLAQDMTEPYPPAQIESLLKLLQQLQQRLPALRWIAGHEALDTRRIAASDDPGRTVFRKRDPGQLFPWVDVLSGLNLQRLDPEKGPVDTTD